MKTLNLEQMENLQGGLDAEDCSKLQSPAVQTIMEVCTICAFMGFAGALIFGPTAVILQTVSWACSFK